MKTAYSPILFGKVSPEGVFVPTNKVLARQTLLGLAGKAVEFIIRPYRSKRSVQQNRYYRGVVVAEIADYMGELDKDKVHRMLAGMFLKQTDILFLPNGKTWEVQTVLSTTSLGKDEFFDEYLEKCRAWALEENGIVIPLPNEVDLTQYSFEE